MPRIPSVAAGFSAVPHLVRPVATGELARHWAELLGAVASTLVATLGFAGLGAAVERLGGRVHAWSGTAAFSARALAGIAVAGTVGLGLGLCGLLEPAITLIVTVTFVAAGLIARPRPPRVPVPRGAGPWAAAGVAAAVFALWCLLAAPPQTWVDTLGYHLGAPALWARLHRVAFSAESRFQYPLLFEHFISLVGGAIPPAALNLATGGLLTMALGGWTAGRFGPAAGWLAVAGWVASSQAGFLSVQVKHDLLAAGLLLSAFAAWDGRRGLFPCGLALGWAAAAKYPSAAPGVAIAIGVAAGERPFSGLGRLAAGAIVALAPFLAFCWLNTGNPVFPLVHGGLGWGKGAQEAFLLLGCPGRDIALDDPGSVPSSIVRLGREMAPLGWVGLPLLLLGGARGTGKALWTSAAGIIALSLVMPCLRFMVPVFPLLCALGAAGVVSFGSGAGWRRWGAGMMAAGALAAGAVQGAGMADFWQFRLAAGLGLEPRQRFLARTLTSLQAAVECAQGLPPGGRLLLVSESRGAPFNAVLTTISQDISDEPVPRKVASDAWLASDIAKGFRQLGITFVAVNHVTGEYRGPITQQAFPWPPAALARYRDFWGRWARNLPGPAGVDPENGGFAFYRIMREPGPAAPAMSFLPGTEGIGAPLPGEEPAAEARRLEGVLQFAPGVAQLQSRLWTSLLRAREWKIAEAWIRDGLNRGFRSPDVWSALGEALRGQGRDREAREAFRRAGSPQRREGTGEPAR